MAKECPIYGRAIYLDCLECEEKYCRNNKKEVNKHMNKIVIGIDQSYKNTGISICVDNELKNISSIKLDNIKSNCERRNILRQRLDGIFKKMSLKQTQEACELEIIIERIRLRSQGFINIDYIKSIGALNSIIIDTASKYNIKVYSVDTRSWKSQIVGTSKPKENKIGINPEKYPTIEYIKNLGYENKILIEVSNKKKKGVFERNGKKYTYNDDAADSACIALYGFSKNRILREEH